MMLQVVLDHLFCHLNYRGTKIASRPKMSSPVTLLQMRKLLEQRAWCVAFDPLHDLARRRLRWRTHQDVHVIFTHHTLHYPDLEGLKPLAYQLSDPFRNLCGQYLVTLLRDPHKVVLNLKNRMAPVSVAHFILPESSFSDLKVNSWKLLDLLLISILWHVVGSDSACFLDQIKKFAALMLSSSHQVIIIKSWTCKLFRNSKWCDQHPPLALQNFDIWQPSKYIRTYAKVI